MGKKKIKMVFDKVGLSFAMIHLILFLCTAYTIYKSSAAQAEFGWFIWIPFDLPWSLIYFFPGKSYSEFVDKLAQLNPLFDYVLYTPYLVHGIIGTIWWYYIPGIFRKVFMNDLNNTPRGN